MLRTLHSSHRVENLLSLIQNKYVTNLHRGNARKSYLMRYICVYDIRMYISNVNKVREILLAFSEIDTCLNLSDEFLYHITVQYKNPN